MTVSDPVHDDNEQIVGVLGAGIRFEELAKMEDEYPSEEE
ncbi:hypothetical protein DFAR_1860011 [Desulfarculales bacterium]